MNEIQITERELFLLIDKIHPEYDSNYQNEFIENGKGIDIHYERKVIRLSDNKELTLGFTDNAHVGYQDFCHSGDFYVDHNKQDVYDETGNTIQEKKDFEAIYLQMQKDGEISTDKERFFSKLPLNKIMVLADASSNAYLKDDRSLLPELADICYSIAVEYKLNAERLWKETFQNKELMMVERKRILSFFKNKIASENKEPLTHLSKEELDDLKTFSW